MTRDEAYQILTGMVKSQNLIKHHLATEAAMKSLYNRISTKPTPADEANWGLVGLLHDADYELCKNHPEKHTLVLEEKIGHLLDPKIMYAIKSHNFTNNGCKPQSFLDWSIYCCDDLTELIIAIALANPDKKLAPLTVQDIIEKLNSTSFAKDTNRNQVRECEKELQIPLNEFIGIVLNAMQEISANLEL